MSKTKVAVFGETGMAGRALVKVLKESGYCDVVPTTHNVFGDKLDFRKQMDVDSVFVEYRPEIVFNCAATVAGIKANRDDPVKFLSDNILMTTNIVNSSFTHGVEDLMNYSSSCVYPADCPQPMDIEHLFTGPFETTNEGYSIAKVAGMKLVEYYRRQYGLNYVSIIPNNMFGPGQDYNPETAHVLGSLIAKFVDAADNRDDILVLWGDGSPRREFVHVEDVANIAVEIIQDKPKFPYINIGNYEDVAIKVMAKKIAVFVGFNGRIVWDVDMPNGMMRKKLCIERMEDSYGRPYMIDWETCIPDMVEEYRKGKI